jgi:hypothetical protein
MRAVLFPPIILVCALFMGCDSAAQTASNPEGGALDGSASDGTGAGDAQPGAIVMGTLTVPGATTGKPWSVRVVDAPASAATAPVAVTTGLTSGSDRIEYTISGVPAGTYYVLGFVDVDASGGSGSTPGDFAGWYGHTGDGNPPPARNAVVPAAGTVRFDFSLVQR